MIMVIGMAKKNDFVSTRLQYLRKKKGVSQAELATRIFVSREAVRDWERKKSEPSCEALVHLSDFYQVSTDYILGIQQPRLLRVDHLSKEQVEVLNKLIHWMEKADSADESQTISIGEKP